MERVGRVSILEDTDGDGEMDASKIYIDSLILPRSLALVPGGALIVENQSLWLTQDTNGDSQADIKTLLDSAYAGGPSPSILVMACGETWTTGTTMPSLDFVIT